MSWKQLNPAIYKNSATGRFLIDGRQSVRCPHCHGFGCAACEGSGEIDHGNVGNILDVVVTNPGHSTTFGTAKAISDFSKNPRELVVFWDDAEIVELAKIRERIHT